MDISIEYRLMCIESKEIQSKWSPQVGDYIVSKASYCSDDDNLCSDDKPCKECLDMSNMFVISGDFSFFKEVGGHHWFYGGGPCVKGGGNRMNSTFCFTMTETGYSRIADESSRSSKSEKLWLPRQDQIQSLFLSGLTNQAKVRAFIKWLDTATYNPYTSSLEMLWLMFYMEDKWRKKWNATSNIKEWETIN